MGKKIRLGVIPAAGEGKRIGYLSTIIPKCLFPLHDRPIIHHVLDNLVRIGVEKVIIPTFFQKGIMFKYFKHIKGEVNADICLLALKNLPKGIALTIESAKEYIDEPFMVILGDDVTVTGSLQPLVDLFFLEEAVAVEGVVKEKNKDVIRRTCCLKLDRNKQISKIIEKPTNPISNLRGCGVYVFDPEIFEYIERTPPLPPRNEVEITNAIGLVATDRKAYGELIDGININVNTPNDLLEAWLAVKCRVVKKR